MVGFIFRFYIYFFSDYSAIIQFLASFVQVLWEFNERVCIFYSKLFDTLGKRVSSAVKETHRLT